MTQPEMTGQLILDLFKIVVRCLDRLIVLWDVNKVSAGRVGNQCFQRLNRLLPLPLRSTRERGDSRRLWAVKGPSGPDQN